jgi:hypothetical protein
LQVLLEMSPGLAVDKYIMSSRDLAATTVTAVASASSPPAAVHLWRPGLAMAAMLQAGWAGELTHPASGQTESLLSLLCWDCPEVRDSLLTGMIQTCFKYFF